MRDHCLNRYYIVNINLFLFFKWVENKFVTGASFALPKYRALLRRPSAYPFPKAGMKVCNISGTFCE